MLQYVLKSKQDAVSVDRKQHQNFRKDLLSFLENEIIPLNSLKLSFGTQESSEDTLFLPKDARRI